MISGLLRLAASALVLAIYALAGLSVIHVEGIPRWVRNGAVRASPDRLDFRTAGMARSEGPPAWLAAVIADSTLDLEVDIRSHRPLQFGPARILTVSRGTSLRNLTLGQEGSDLIIRLRTPATNLNGSPSYTIPGIFKDDGWHVLEMSVEPGELLAVLDGRVVLRERLPRRSLQNWDPSHRVVLGNELGGQRPWLGEIRRAAIRVRGETIDYVEPGLLSVPHSYWALGPAPQEGAPPATGGGGGGSEARGLHALRDEALNFFGFIPLGLFLVLVWRRLSVAWVTLLCAAVSAATEISQWFLPARDPQFIDLALNVLGGALGGALGRGAQSLLTRPRPE